MAAPDPGSGRNYRLVVSLVSSPSDLGTVTGSGPADRPVFVLPPRPDDRRDPWLRTVPGDGNTPPPAGQPGHSKATYVRRQPARIVDGRFHGGHADVFEVICPSCGDHPYPDYSEVPPRLQWLRGPRTLQAAVATYHKHLGLPPPASTGPESSGPGNTPARHLMPAG